MTLEFWSVEGQISCQYRSITISSNMISALAAIFFTSYSVEFSSDNELGQLALIGLLQSAVKAATHIKSTRLNSPITELITITIATTTYPTKPGNFQNGIIFYFRHCLYLKTLSISETFSQITVFVSFGT